jgi:hypothetical protein
VTLKKSEESALFYVDPPPQTDSAHDVGLWAYLMIERLAQFLRRPEFPGVVFAQITTNLAPEFKAEEGLMVNVGPNVLGPQPGLYVYEQGSWKKVT